jgi:hypothetical protein
MQDAAGSPIVAWESYYVIVGSSAAALTGLQFVVAALLADSRKQSAAQAMDAYGTPTIVHFCAVLLLSAIVSAPWPALWQVALAFGICGLAGLGYIAVVIRRTRRVTGYQPVFEDWLWHGAFPLLSYAALFAAAVSLQRHPLSSLFVVAGAALLLLFVGIHNAWDTATYIALDQSQPHDEHT